MNNKTYQTMRRAVFTVAFAAGVCGAAWGQEALTTVVQAGSGVTKIGLGQEAATEVLSNATVEAASGTTVRIEGAAPAPGKLARLKLTRREDLDPNIHTGENPGNDPGGQSGEISQQHNLSLKRTDDNGQTLQLKNGVNTVNDLALPDIIKGHFRGDDEINDIETMKLEGYKEGIGNVTLNYKSNAAFIGCLIYRILFACPGESDISWLLVDGEGFQDGSLNIAIPADILPQLARDRFVVFVILK